MFVAHLVCTRIVHRGGGARGDRVAEVARRGGAGDHAMSAWRVPLPQTLRVGYASLRRTRVDAGFDDDGEPRGATCAYVCAPSSTREKLWVVAAVVTNSRAASTLGKARFEHIRERVAVLDRAAGVQSGGDWPPTTRSEASVEPWARPHSPRGARRQMVLLESGEDGRRPTDRIGTGETDEPETDEPNTDEPDTETYTACDSNDVAEDIRRRLAEAAERRAAAANAASSIASVRRQSHPPTPSRTRTPRRRRR